MIHFQLSILVLHIPMIFAQPNQTDRFHRGLLWKKSWYPIQKYTFTVKKARPRKYKLLNDWKVWYQCEAKNATRLYTILVCMYVKPTWLRLYITTKRRPIKPITNYHASVMLISYETGNLLTLQQMYSLSQVGFTYILVLYTVW